MRRWLERKISRTRMHNMASKHEQTIVSSRLTYIGSIWLSRAYVLREPCYCFIVRGLFQKPFLDVLPRFCNFETHRPTVTGSQLREKVANRLQDCAQHVATCDFLNHDNSTLAFNSIMKENERELPSSTYGLFTCLYMSFFTCLYMSLHVFTILQSATRQGSIPNDREQQVHLRTKAARAATCFPLDSESPTLRMQGVMKRSLCNHHDHITYTFLTFSG